jgi:hypothetical protein
MQHQSFIVATVPRYSSLQRFTATFCIASLVVIFGTGWASAAELTSLSFGEYYSKAGPAAYWDWGLKAGLAIGAGVAIYVTGGTGGPIVSAIGTWVGNLAGLSGAAATKFGLAMIGGGSIASGGGGIAAGVAIITAALTFSKDALPAGANYILEKYDQTAFFERSRTLPVFPLPHDGQWTPRAKEVIAGLDKLYDKSKPHYDQRNHDTVKGVLGQISGIAAQEATAPKDVQRILIAQALLEFHNGNMTEAGKYARDALIIRDVEDVKDCGTGTICKLQRKANGAMDSVAEKGKAVKELLPESIKSTIKGPSLPWAIIAASGLASAKPDVKASLNAFQKSLEFEPDNKLAPLVVAVYLDRLGLRQDIVQVVDYAQAMTDINTKIPDQKLRAACLLVLGVKVIVQIKLRQDAILLGKLDAKTRQRLIAEYKELSSLADRALMEIKATGIMNSDRMKFKEIAQLERLVHDYKTEVATMR